MENTIDNVSPKQLIDIGERNIVRDLIIPQFPKVGENFDDCAEIKINDEISLLISTDPCPTPTICEIEKNDYYYYGWYTVLINVSDLAAMGAKPAGILISTIMPQSMKVNDYQDYLKGIQDASNLWECPVIGGNIKDGNSFSSSGTAIGMAHPDYIMRRTGAKSGDLVYVIGENGYFLASVFNRELNLGVSDKEIEKLEKNLYKPEAKIVEGIAISNSKTVTSCMDCSDGTIGCLYELAELNNLDIIIDNDALNTHRFVHQVAKRLNINPGFLFLGWGDWQLTCLVPSSKKNAFENVLNSINTMYKRIGYAIDGEGQVLLKQNKRYRRITNFSSERFSKNSIFTAGLHAYLNFIQEEPLVYGKDVKVDAI